MANSLIKELELSTHNYKQLIDFLSPLVPYPFGKNRHEEIKEFFSGVNVKRKLLDIFGDLSSILLSPITPGSCILLHNLPLDRVVPPSLKGANKTTSLSELVSFSICYLLGVPISFANSKLGNYIHNLFPETHTIGEQSGKGTCFLEWHIDDAFALFPPDYVILNCLRGDPQAKTLISNFEISSLSLRCFESLTERNFIFRHMDGSIFKANSPDDERSSVLTRTEHGWFVRFDPLYTEATTKEAAESLRMLYEQVVKDPVSVTLEAGDAVVFSNLLSAHGRSEFAARFDGTDRWVQKTFVANANERESHLRSLTSSCNLMLNSKDWGDKNGKCQAICS